MVSVVHLYNRWSKNELNCYVDGQLVSHTEMAWLVNTSDVSYHRSCNHGSSLCTSSMKYRTNSLRLCYCPCWKSCSFFVFVCPCFCLCLWLSPCHSPLSLCLFLRHSFRLSLSLSISQLHCQCFWTYSVAQVITVWFSRSRFLDVSEPPFLSV